MMQSIVDRQMREVSNACKFLVGKPEGERAFKRPRPRWKGNIKMDVDDERREGKIEMKLRIGIIGGTF
jgi:hypothetical protein